MDHPGTRIKTEVWVNEASSYQEIYDEAQPGMKYHYALWRLPTVKIWWDVQRNSNPVEQEKEAWKILLLETSLGEVEHDRVENLTDESLQRIWKFRPGKIPSFLAKEMLQRTYLSSREVNQIERESMILWGTSGPQKIRDYHPMLERVSNSMALWERFGVRTWDAYGEISTYDFQCIMHCLSCYANMMKLNDQQRAARASAVQQSGAGQYMKR